MDESDPRLEAHHALLKAKERLLRKHRVEIRLAEAERALREQKERLRSLEETWRRESEDVESLTKMSVVGLITAVLGTKELRLRKEKRELAAAALKLDAAREVADRLQFDRDLLADDARAFDGAEADYRSALEAKEEILLAGGEAGRQLADLAELEANNRERARELREALGAGRTALRQLDYVVDNLGSASNWGVWDMWGGGWIATSMKHSRLDDAKAAAIAAQSSLARFRRELADVGRDVVANVDLGGFSRFADYFFDGFITDWAIQSRISSALSCAETARGTVQRLLFELEREDSEGATALSDLHSRRQALIERA